MNYQSFKERRKRGYDMNLYRNPKEGILGGVCAGIADHFDIAPWVARLIFIALVIFLQVPVFLYFVAWILIAKRPAQVQEVMVYDEKQRRYKRPNMFNYRHHTSNRVKEAETRMQQINQRVSDIESYVTSRAYRVNKEINDI